MNIYAQTFSSIVILGGIILLVMYLRNIGLFKSQDGGLFSTIITRLTLPAIIMYALSHATLEWKYLDIVGFTFFSELFLFSIAWLSGKYFKLSSAQMGSYILVSVFGSSALLGYALIAQVFPHDANAIAEASFISELGVGLPLFIFGVMIAMYYGNQDKNNSNILKSIIEFLRSPIFIAIVAGVMWSLFKLPLKGDFISVFFDTVHIIGKANTLMVALLVGVTLRFDSLKKILLLVLMAIILKLILNPFIVASLSYFIALEEWQLDVLIIESAMPSAMLSVALAKQYGCDATLASKLVFATLLTSTLSVGIMMYLLN
jgi:predicted permease